jgi:hypothetical protein
MPDGTKYYRWTIGVTQAEHRRLIGNTPVVVAEVLGALFSVLPPELQSDRHLSATRVVPDSCHFCRW